MAAEGLTGLATSVLVQRTLVLAREEPVLQSDEYWAHVRVLHFRSGREVFDTSFELCSSQDTIARAVGADILAQLGVQDGVAAFPFADESEARLVALLTDTEPVVAASALYALGHLGRGEPSELAGLAKHASEDVRCALAYALGGRNDAVSIAALIELCGDMDTDTRSWATFALGSLSEEDSPAIRDALAARLSDADDEVRGEAILGLARRLDDRVLQPLQRELSGREVGTLAIEAAEAMPRPELIPHLEALYAAHPGDRAIDQALNRCREASGGVSAEDEARIVSLLRADVEATIGPGHGGAIIEAAARRRLYADVPAQYVGDVVDDVQQYFHDAFVDTTWPACPHHPNHPLWFSDGWWRCGRIEEPIARLGELSGANQEHEG